MARLDAVNPHPRDERIRFVDDTHTYYVDGSSEGYISSTTLVHTLFEEFDADKVIGKMRSSRNWYKSPYKGMTDAQIKDKWETNRDIAASEGTKMHENIERYYNSESHSTKTKEFMMFAEYYKDHPQLVPFRSEWVIFDEESKVSGSVDMLYRSRDPGPDGSYSYVMADWKRSKEIKFSNVYQSGTDETTSDLPDCNFIHYSIQLGIYKYILEKNYGIKIDESFIVVLHPKQQEYNKIHTKNMDVVVRGIMDRRAGKKNNIAPSNKRKVPGTVREKPCLFKMDALKF